MVVARLACAAGLRPGRRSAEIIDEFPFFSYLLADLHPHVLAMPFALLAISLALNLFLSPEASPMRWLRLRLGYRTQAWLSVLLFAIGVGSAWFGLSTLSLRLTVLGLASMIAGGLLFVRIPVQEDQSRLRLFLGEASGESQVGIRLYLDTPSFLLYALVLGGLAFLNTWDLPFYLVLFAGAYAVRRWLLPGETAQAPLSQLLVDLISAALALGAVSVLLYLPFYLGFSSQAGGIIPNLIFPTRGAQLWVMFGTLLLPLLAYLFYLWKAHGSPAQMRKGFALAGGFVLVLWLSSWLFALVILLLPGVSTLFLNSLGATGRGRAVCRIAAAPGHCPGRLADRLAAVRVGAWAAALRQGSEACAQGARLQPSPRRTSTPCSCCCWVLCSSWVRSSFSCATSSAGASTPFLSSTTRRGCSGQWRRLLAAPRCCSRSRGAGASSSAWDWRWSCW